MNDQIRDSLADPAAAIATYPTDMINKPSHYMLMPEKQVEVIHVIKAALTPEEYQGYCKGNMIKYLLRKKIDAYEDVGKAGKYSKFYRGEE